MIEGLKKFPNPEEMDRFHLTPTAWNILIDALDSQQAQLERQEWAIKYLGIIISETPDSRVYKRINELLTQESPPEGERV